MRLPPQISGGSVVALGHFNPLIFRPEWLKEKEILVGSDYESVALDVEHPEIVSFRIPWGQMQVDRERFSIAATQEPLIRLHDFFVKCFQALPETPMRALGINREVHFDAGSRQALDHIGDTLAPKQFWHDFVTRDGEKVGGLRSLVMEQAITKGGSRERLDGGLGWIHVKVEPSLRPVPNGAFVHVNDHYELAKGDRLSDGRTAAELVTDNWEISIRRAESYIDRIMGLANGSN
jgi:hypothetical protein